MVVHRALGVSSLAEAEDCSLLCDSKAATGTINENVCSFPINHSVRVVCDGANPSVKCWNTFWCVLGLLGQWGRSQIFSVLQHWQLAVRCRSRSTDRFDWVVHYCDIFCHHLLLYPSYCVICSMIFVVCWFVKIPLLQQSVKVLL